jgi:two-component system, LytTR family, sensor kinase
VASSNKKAAAWPGWAATLLWLGVFLTLGLLLTSYRYLEALASGDQLALREAAINEVSAAMGAGLLFWPLRAFCLRFPVWSGPKLETLGLYALALLLFSILHTTWNWVLRLSLYPPAGLGSFDYGVMPTRYLMELGMDAVAFVTMAFFIHGWERLKAARQRELRAAQLESSLARAELQNLRLRLQPHFLFNALNTISATMYDNPAAADEMIGKLAELLRASLRQGPADEVPLDKELELLGAYLALLEARFGDRLEVSLAVEPESRKALVPALLLQPLIENAIKHGRAEKEGHGKVMIAAGRQGEKLALAIENDLPAAPRESSSEEGGFGLASVSERLRLLHGESQSFQAGQQGELFRVEIRLPYREAG